MRSTAERMAVAEVVLRNAAELVSQFLGKHAPDGGVSFRFCKTPKYGDVFASRETAMLACAVSVVCGCGLCVYLSLSPRDASLRICCLHLAMYISTKSL